MVHVPYLPLPVEPEPSSGFAKKAPIAHGMLQLRIKDAPTSVVAVATAAASGAAAAVLAEVADAGPAAPLVRAAPVSAVPALPRWDR